MSRSTIFKAGIVLAMLLPQMSAAAISERSREMNRIFETYNKNNYNKCGFGIIAHYYSLPGADPTVKSIMQLRPIEDTSFVSEYGHFRIHFDTSGFNEPVLYNSNGQPIPRSWPAFVDSVAQICEHVYYVEVDSLGFPPPASDNGAGGGDQYDIYIEALPTGEYGYTDWNSADSIKKRINPMYATWTVIRNEFESTYTQGIPAIEVTIAHEFNHGIQLGNYGLWPNDIWFYELTSTWMEQMVYPGIKDYYQYLPYFFDDLSVNPFNLYEPGLYAGYERCVFGIFVQNEYGAQVMKSIWQHMATEPVIPAIEDAFKAIGVNPSAAFQLFSEWNYFTGTRAQQAAQFNVTSYPLASSYPMASIQGYGSMSGSGVTFSGEALRLTEHFFQIGEGTDTAGVAVSNNNFAAAEIYDTTQFQFSVGISTGGTDCVKELTGGYCLFFNVADNSHWSLVPFIAGTVLAAAGNFVFPQPFNPLLQQLKIPYPFQQLSSATLYIYGVSGDLVNKLEGDSHIVRYLGGSYFEWDGSNSAGRKVGSGVYIYIVSDGSKSLMGKIAVVRN